MTTSSSPRTVIGIAIGAGTNVDPLDIASARRLSRATVREMKQKLGRALRRQRDGDPDRHRRPVSSAGVELRGADGLNGGPGADLLHGVSDASVERQRRSVYSAAWIVLA